MTTFAYVCTNYNNAKISISAALSFIQQFGEDAIVVIVDSGSSRSCVNELTAFAKTQPAVTVLDTMANQGYFAGLNLGLDHLKTLGVLPTWVFVGNNDLTFKDGISAALAQRADSLKYHAIVAPNLITLDGVHQNPHIIEGISSNRRLLYSIYYRSYFAATVMRRVSGWTKSMFKRPDTKNWENGCKVWAGHGACYLLTPRFFEVADRLDNFSFLYFEEAFLALQMQALGETTWYEPSLQIEHLCNGTIGKLPGRKVWKFSRDAYLAYQKRVAELSTIEGRRL